MPPLPRLRLPLLVSLALLCWAAPVATLSAASLGTNFWNLNWHAPDDCFANVKNVSGENPWNPRFLADIAPYSLIRCMDWDRTNSSPRVRWTERARKEASTQSTVAYEWMIDLANRQNADLWVCIPHLTVSRANANSPSDYALRLALLMKTGVDMGDVDLTPLLDKLSHLDAAALVAAGGVRTTEPLKPGLKLYVEYSNETWNSIFKQSTYCIQEGMALDLNPGGKVDAKGYDYTAGFRYHAWAAIRVFRAMDLVFGPDSPRVVKVDASHVANAFVSRQHMAIFKNSAHNPWGTKATALAIAPYFGANVAGDDPEAATKLSAHIAKVLGNVQEHERVAKDNGLALVAYEAGQHVTKHADVINRQPVMYDLYKEYLEAMGPRFDVIVHYAHVGRAGANGAWGAMEKTGQDLAAAPKMRALVEFARANNKR